MRRVDNATMATTPRSARSMTKKRVRRKATAIKILSVVAALAAGPAAVSSDQILNADGEPSYGVDVSFPIHHHTLAQHEFSSPFGNDRQRAYDTFMSGCREHFVHNPHACDYAEEDRIDNTLRQPASMQNYTSTGFKLVRAPEQVFHRLSRYWAGNYDKRHKEDWYGFTYVNHWEAPTYMLNIKERAIRGSGPKLKRDIWDNVKPLLEEWTGMELKPSCNEMGIREYTKGAMFAPHADRMPLITSAIINVAQEGMEEDWPLEVYGRDGLAYNVTMKPGDMLLYESHSLVHGRPFAMRGKSFANIFVSTLMRYRSMIISIAKKSFTNIILMSPSHSLGPLRTNWQTST